MQLKYLYKKLSNASNGLDGTDYSVVVYERYSTLRSYDQLKKQHCNDEVIFKVLKVPQDPRELLHPASRIPKPLILLKF